MPVDSALRVSTKRAEVLVLYLKRTRAKSWEWRCGVGALRIQRLEGSGPGTMGFAPG